MKKQPDESRARTSGKQTMTRREMIRTTGLAALGLVYSRPKIEILRSAPSAALAAQDYGESGSGSGSESGNSSS